MFAQKTTLFLAVLATAAPILAYNPYETEDSLFARGEDLDFDDLYVRDVDDYVFEMQKRDAVETYLQARDDLESLLYARAQGQAGAKKTLGDERTAIKDQNKLNSAKGKLSNEKNEAAKLKSELAGLNKQENSQRKKIAGDRSAEKKAQAQVGKDFSQPKRRGLLSELYDYEW